MGPEQVGKQWASTRTRVDQIAHEDRIAHRERRHDYQAVYTVDRIAHADQIAHDI